MLVAVRFCLLCISELHCCRVRVSFTLLTAEAGRVPNHDKNTETHTLICSMRSTDVPCVCLSLPTELLFDQRAMTGKQKTKCNLLRLRSVSAM